MTGLPFETVSPAPASMFPTFTLMGAKYVFTSPDSTEPLVLKICSTSPLVACAVYTIGFAFADAIFEIIINKTNTPAIPPMMLLLITFFFLAGSILVFCFFSFFTSSFDSTKSVSTLVSSFSTVVFSSVCISSTSF